MKWLAAMLAAAIALPLSLGIAYSLGAPGAGKNEGAYGVSEPGAGSWRSENVGGRTSSAISRPPTASHAQVPGDAYADGELQAADEVRAGHRIAQAICRVCHIVEPAQVMKPILVHPGPSFMDIANRTGTTVDSLKESISTRDWDLQSRPIMMRNQRLSNESTEAVASYIMSLKGPPR
jgi:mono/diheme cytochrome c family protein